VGGGEGTPVARWSDVLGAVRTMCPESTWKGLTPQLFCLFWGLTLGDLTTPKGSYESELSKQQAAMRAIEEGADPSGRDLAKRRKEKERVQETIEKLTQELKEQEKCVGAVGREMHKWKGSLFPCGTKDQRTLSSPLFLHFCVFPRALMSDIDAIYAARYTPPPSKPQFPLYPSLTTCCARACTPSCPPPPHFSSPFVAFGCAGSSCACMTSAPPAF